MMNGFFRKGNAVANINECKDGFIRIVVTNNEGNTLDLFGTDRKKILKRADEFMNS